MLRTGKKYAKTTLVTSANTAERVGSGTLAVFATPAMLALIEAAAVECVAAELEPGATTVGTLLNVQHLAATPIGMKVTACVELTEIDRRRLVFSANVYDEKGLIGKGLHERFIVDAEKFQAKADAKRD